MPQLDKFTFLDQVLSVIFFLLIIYLVNTYVFLPKLIYILKFRTRILKILRKKQKNLVFLLNNCKTTEQLADQYYFNLLNFVNKNAFEIVKNYAYLLQFSSFKFLEFRK
jgi:hypothetical protein